jgi:hypothetical protein
MLLRTMCVTQDATPPNELNGLFSFVPLSVLGRQSSTFRVVIIQGKSQIMINSEQKIVDECRRCKDKMR